MPKSKQDDARKKLEDASIESLLNAHNQIISAWFSHWDSQERSRIDLAFAKNRQEQPNNND
jgi:hypothetical protein